MTHTPFVHPGLLFDDYRPPEIELTELPFGFRADYAGAMTSARRSSSSASTSRCSCPS